MELTFEQQLQEVQNHYSAGDFDLAHRRMLDCAIETADMNIFSQTLAYCEWLENNAHNTSHTTIQEKALQLLQQIATVPVQNTSVQDSLLLTAENISKRYSRGNFALNDINLSLSASEIIGLVGENGNGKTTLLRLLATDLLPDSGTITYHFVDNKQGAYGLRSRLLYVPQRIPRWWGSLMDNLNFTLAHYGVKGQANLLWGEMMVARLGLRPYRELSWNRISSGYRTRFELAKTLLRSPHILLLDEPLANLDINAQQTILQDLKFLSQSITRPFGMLLSSQHIYEVEKVSDSIVFLRNGTAQYQQQQVKENEPEETALVIEMETPQNRDAIAAAFAHLPLQKIQYNGNVFILYFNKGTEMPQVLNALSQSNIEIMYLRNISRSSRRFFAVS